MKKLTSSEPFWLVKNGIIESYASLTENLNTEILIVGGGITGSLIAHQCIKEGYQTVLIDRREIAHGSSSATTSMLQYEIDTPLCDLIEMIGEEGAVKCYQACSDSIDILQNLSREIFSQAGFEMKDSLYFAGTKKDIPDLKKEYECRKKHNFPVEWLEPEVIEKKYKLHNSQGGILSKKGGSIDAFRMAHDLLDYNSKKGLKVYDKTEAQEIKYKKTGVEVKTNYGNSIKAKKIIFCNGYEATEIIKEKIVDLMSTYAIIGERYEDDQSEINNTLFWNTAKPYLYMRTTDDNRFLIGGEDDDFQNAGKRDALLEKKAQKLEKKLNKLWPEYKFRRDFAWAGTFGETKDGLPYIGKHKKFKNTLFVLGFGGNGITFSVIGMQIISDLLKDKENELSEYFRFGR